MARHIKDIMAEVTELNIKLQQILYHSQYEMYDDLSGLEWDKTDADQLFMLDELCCRHPRRLYVCRVLPTAP